MANPRGFLDFKRKDLLERDPIKRILDYDDFHIMLEEDSRKEQASRCMNCGVPFCGAGIKIKNATIGCPLHNFIPEWNTLVYKGLYEEAYKRLSLTSPFPEFTSRVCPALCEVGCICNIHDKPVSVKDNELFIIENAFENGFVKPNQPKKRINKKVCVIGSGPSGLAVANDLNQMGYSVVVYEKEDRFGGLLMYGIPNMKLEKSIIDRRIDIMKKEGISFVGKTTIGNDISAKDVLINYDAVVFATGSSVPRDLKVKGRELNNIVFAVDYLKENTKALLNKKEEKRACGKNVLIIGGGDTGNDCVATAIRQKAKSVLQFEIVDKPSVERTSKWPEWPNNLKVDYGAVEHIALTGFDQRMFNMTAKQFIGQDNVEQVLAKKVKWENGKMIDLEETLYPCDLVILAMGFVGTPKELIDSFSLEADSRGNILTNNHQTCNKKIFACGDAKTGQSLVVSSIASGKECAIAVDKYLKSI